MVAAGLSAVGVTKERVSALVGEGCGCAERQDWLNRLGHRLGIVVDLPATVDGERDRDAPSHGPGTELKKLLKRIGITASPDCSCNVRARTMDERGIEWCEANIDEIVGWLREEAGKRGLPFLDAAGRVLVRRAIANARKAADAERPPLSAGG